MPPAYMHLQYTNCACVAMLSACVCIVWSLVLVVLLSGSAHIWYNDVWFVGSVCVRLRVQLNYYCVPARVRWTVFIYSCYGDGALRVHGVIIYYSRVCGLFARASVAHACVLLICFQLQLNWSSNWSFVCVCVCTYCNGNVFHRKERLKNRFSVKIVI